MTVARKPPTVWFSVRGFPFHVPRAPRRFFEEMSGGETLFPLIVLAGLNAVNQLDQTAFGVLGPDIRDSFHLSNQGYLTLVALTQLGGLLLAVPLAYYSDRLQRVAIAVIGAAIWAVFGVVTGLSVTVLMLVIARSGAGMGRAVITPSHNSLLSDYYPPEVRADVFGFHSIGLAIGAFVGPVFGGLLAHYFGWRVPFFVFAIPTIVFVILGIRLHEPGRGHWERAAAGASAAVIGTDEIPPSFAESIRILWQVGTLRRIWYSLPFLAASFIGLITLTSLYYEQVFHLDDFQRGVVAACAEPAQIVAILLGIPLAARLMLRDPGLGMRLLAVLGTIIAGCWTIFALAPNLGVAIAMNIAVSGLSSLLVPGIYASLSLTIPPKVRSLGFSMAALFIVPGLLALYIVGGIADSVRHPRGPAHRGPIFLIGAWILASGSIYVRSDINRVWTSTAAQAEVMLKRQQGEVKLLLVRNVDVHYDGVQVLFGVNFEVDEGEIVALLGTNGAGKSTLLKTISGLVEATNGAVVFDGRDMTYAPPNEVAGRGVVQMPGGAGHVPHADRRRASAPRELAPPQGSSPGRGLDRTRARAVPDPARPHRRAGRQPVGRPAADARAGHGVHRAAAPADDRRALARARADDRRAAAAARARHRRAGNHRHPRRAVGEPRAHDRGDRVLHGEGRDPVPRPDRGAARTPRRAPVGVPRRARQGKDDRGGDPVANRSTAARISPNGHEPADQLRRHRLTLDAARPRPSAGSRRCRTFPSRRPLGDRRLHRPERRRQDHPLRHDLGVRDRRRGHHRRGRGRTKARHHEAGARAGALLGLGRSSRTGDCSRR